MSEETAVESESAPLERPQRKERVRDVYGGGKWDSNTGRYIPVGGGSRTKVPTNDDPHVPRYAGMMGIDSEQAERIQTMSALYTRLGGLPMATPGKTTKFLGEILERKAKIKPIEEDELAL